MEGGLTVKYYLAGGQRIAMRTPNNNVSYLFSDHLGSTSLTTDPAGNVTSEMRYTPWGDTRFTSGNSPTNYRFTGQRQEASFGLYFYNARWYDSYLNRFTQPDSIVPLASQGTQAWDRYAFVNNNPVRYNDPTGHMIDEGRDEGGDYTWEDQAHDAYLIMWARLRLWEADSAWGLMAGALRHESHMDIVGQGLDQIRNDPDVLDVQKRLVARIMADPRYWLEGFATDSIGNDVYLGNQGIDMLNGATWMQRSAKLDATVSVSEDGVMSISWATRDTLDLNPDWGGGLRTGINAFLYNTITTVTGGIWHGLLGASNTMTTSASWQTTVYPYCQQP